MDLQTFRRWLYWISSAVVVIAAIFRIVEAVHPSVPPAPPAAITQQEAFDDICGPDRCAWIRQAQQLAREGETEPANPAP